MGFGAIVLHHGDPVLRQIDQRNYDAAIPGGRGLRKLGEIESLSACELLPPDEKSP
ncbi:MAG TPA: hypothetical protein VMW19_04265 [Myxococcota bacterium]|nr:hypothetical protein [Myxococcota bacterium]